ncbi:MAG: hypothetical protein M3460_21155 [Actinomycetota bacterium]|nr:hypothetical protein [Actinomycetota bacterium]
MHELIVSPFLGNYIVVRPGRHNGMKISYSRSDEVEFVADLDVLSESDVCSCSAGDDNPF